MNKLQLEYLKAIKSELSVITNPNIDLVNASKLCGELTNKKMIEFGNWLIENYLNQNLDLSNSKKFTMEEIISIYELINKNK